MRMSIFVPSNFFVSSWTKDLTFDRRARSSGSASIDEFFASRAPRINFVLGVSEILFAATAPKPAVPPVITTVFIGSDLSVELNRLVVSCGEGDAVLHTGTPDPANLSCGADVGDGVAADQYELGPR